MTEFRVRIKNETHQRISDAAEQNGRSTNAEYVYRLEESLKTDNELRQGITEIKKQLAEIERILADRVEPDD